MHKNTYISRYWAGEREAVWRELVALGPKALEEPVLQDAKAIAEEVVNRAYHNLQMLRDRLTGLGYRFENPGEVLVDADETDIAAAINLEHSMGELPLVVQTWYRRIASVDFRQHPEQVRFKESMSADTTELPVTGLGFHVPLVFLRVRKCVELKKALIAQYATAGISTGTLDKFFTLGDCASNGDPKGLVLPSSGVDGTLYNDGAGDVGFVQELRKAFASGGFPFWKRRVQYRRGVSLIGYRPDFEKLVTSLAEDLLAI